MTGPQVLVVEDNERNMKLFRDVLESSGYRTLEATTGERAVELVFEHCREQAHVLGNVVDHEDSCDGVTHRPRSPQWRRTVARKTEMSTGLER